MATATSSFAPLPLIELTSSGSPNKSMAKLVTGKRPGRKLTRIPPSKRRLVLPADEQVSEGFVPADPPSDEPTLAELYPSLIFPASPFSNASASGGSFADAWDKIRPIFEELNTPEAIDRFSHKENQNKKLKYENDQLRQQVTELSSTVFSAAAKKQLEAQIESLQAKFKSTTDLNQELTSKIGKLKARRANPITFTLGLLSKEEQAAEAIASLEEEEEQPFLAIHKEPRLTEEVPFRDTFGLLIPSSSVTVSATSASQMATTTSASSQPLSLALPPLTSGPRAKRTPCRRSSLSPGPSAIHASTTESTFIALPSSIPSSSSSFLASSLHLDQLLIALERDNSKLKAQVEALKANLPPSHIELTQLQEKIALQTQQIEAMKKELQHQQQLLKNKELERKTLELQVDWLNSRLQVETALKDKAISDVSHKNILLGKVERLHNIFLSEQAQDLSSKEFAFLQEQEQRKTQDAEISSLQKELEQLKLERDTLKDQNTKLRTKFQSYKEHEEDRWEDKCLAYLRSPKFNDEYVRRMIGTLNHIVTGVIQQLREVEALFEAAVNEKLCLEEEAIRAKEKELCAELGEPSPMEVPVSTGVASSSYAATPKGTFTSLPLIIELTSPMGLEKSPEEAPTKK
ncbi:dynactin subunit 1-like [Zingiber officinale]|uniref:dynactin subunit 1-like n=1 Tax=Zingiber officinale TaxID=94328 RepID=UPI001C4CF90B|nr:dynactin subunit 1-like [Zingiber officinale]